MLLAKTKTRIILGLSGLIMAFCPLASPLHAAPPVLKVGIYQNAPQVFYTEATVPQGIFVELLEHIAQIEGWSLEYIPLPFSESFDALEAGAIDILVSVGVNAERQALYDFNYHNIVSNWARIYTPTEKNISSILDLNHKSIAVMKDDIHYQAFLNMMLVFGFECDFQEVESYPAVFAAVEAGVVDAGIVNRLVAIYEADKYDILSTDVIFNPIELRYAFTKNTHQSIISAFDTNMALLKADDNSAYYQILDRWVGSQITEKTIIEPWVYWVLGIGGVLLITAVLISFKMRHRVRKSTEAYVEKDREYQVELERRERSEEEKAKIEAALIQAQKMEAVGRLAGGVAHDFNNLLTGIIGFSELALMDIDDKEAVAANIQEVVETGHRATKLTQQLLMFSRHQPPQKQLVCLNEVVTGLEKMLRRLIKPDIDLSVALEPELKEIEADINQIEQVIINLGVNASDAMPGGGRLQITTENVVIGPDNYLTEVDENFKPGTYICLSVEDTGIGMDAKTQKQIFEPFFTTKEAGKGTGLGLSVVYGIVKSHRGMCHVYSEPNHGTVFRIYFPLADAASPQAAAVTSMDEENLSGSGERILLIEDDDNVRSFVTAALRRHGYIVDQVNGLNPAEGLLSQGNRFDIMFSDVILNDGSGLEFGHSVTTRFPNIRVILTSGYLGQPESHDRIAESDFVFIQKPYTISQILRVIKRVLR